MVILVELLCVRGVLSKKFAEDKKTAVSHTRAQIYFPCRTF